MATKIVEVAVSVNGEPFGVKKLMIEEGLIEGTSIDSALVDKPFMQELEELFSRWEVK